MLSDVFLSLIFHLRNHVLISSVATTNLYAMFVVISGSSEGSSPRGDDAVNGSSNHEQFQDETRPEHVPGPLPRSHGARGEERDQRQNGDKRQSGRSRNSLQHQPGGRDIRDLPSTLYRDIALPSARPGSG